MLDFLPPVTPDHAVKLDASIIAVNCITTRPIVDRDGNPVRWDALYVGMRVPGSYLTDDSAYDAAIAYITDPDPWQRNFRSRMHSHHHAIPGLA